LKSLSIIYLNLREDIVTLSGLLFAEDSLSWASSIRTFWILFLSLEVEKGIAWTGHWRIEKKLRNSQQEILNRHLVLMVVNDALLLGLCSSLEHVLKTRKNRFH
jgi:hypothetical protein